MPTEAYLLPTLHTAGILRTARPLTDVIRYDLAKASRTSMYGHMQDEKFCVVLPSNPTGLEAAVREAVGWMQRWISMRCPVAVDVETSSLSFWDTKLYSIALCGEDGNNCGVTFTLSDLITLPMDALRELLKWLRRLLADPQVPLTFHNAPFDKSVLMRKGFDIQGQTWDTQGLHHLVQPDIYHTLGWVGHTYLDVEPWKLNHLGEKMAFSRDVVELLIYNAKDAINTAKLRQPLLAEIFAKHMNSTLVSWQMAFSDLAARMELAGVPVNQAMRRRVGDSLLKEIDEHLYHMRRMLNWPDFNPVKPTHAREALFNKRFCGITPTIFTPKTQEPSTSYKAIIDYLEHPFVQHFNGYVEKRGIYSTQYLDPGGRTFKGEISDKGGSYAQAIYPDGRLHCKWNPTGQKGSRFSSQPNLQNVPKYPVNHRLYMEAPEGRIIVGSDKDQLELRLIAVRCGVEELLAEMRKPDGDPHTLAALNCYGQSFLTRSEKERKLLRDMIKNVVYASVYMAGVRTVWRTIRERKQLDSAMRGALTLQEVGRITRSYFGRYTQIPQWHQMNYAFQEQNGYLEIPPFGRRRYFPVQPAPYNEVANWPIQTVGSDIVGMEMVQIDDEIRRRFKDAWVILHGHDAVYIECYEKDAEEVAQVVDRIFGATYVDGPAGPVHLTGRAEISKNISMKPNLRPKRMAA
jgi:DNA polymerase I-like protein with 3'-5' exonuclease and polymerase domains